MDYGELLKPDRRVIAVFLVLAILSFLDLYAFGHRCIPCRMKPLVAPDIQVFWTEGFCSLSSNLLGVTIQFTLLSYMVLGFYILILPYLLACLITRYIWKRSWLGRIREFLRIK